MLCSSPAIKSREIFRTHPLHYHLLLDDSPWCPSHPTSPVLFDIPNDIIQRLGKVFHVARVQAGHAYPAVFRHVDVPLLADGQDLSLGDSRERKHADLARDVVPVARRAQSVQFGLEALSHLDDPAGHGPQVLLPLLEQFRVIEHDAGDPGAVGWRVGNLRPLQDGQLAAHTLHDVLCVGARAGDEVERACSFAVQTEVFGKGLRDDQLEALLDEIPDREVVLGQVTGRETLVGAVEEGEELLRADDLGDLFPLILRRVHARGVVRAGVQEDDTASWGGLQRRQHAVQVEHLRLRGEVWVCLDRELHVREDLVVVGPCWVREVDRWCRFGQEFGQE